MKTPQTIYALFGLLLLPQSLLAWGGRGHAAICEAAVALVKNLELKEFLQSKPQIMAHLCNIPDTYWRGLPAPLRKLGDPGHFINPENLGLKLSDIPTDYKAIVETYTGQENKTKVNQKILSVPNELGSIWWRADQFYRRAIKGGVTAKASALPQDSKEEQDEDLPYNKNIYGMFVNLGLMGHFIGDAGQPFHSTSDYDGYAANHGGIHAYYEEASVSEFGPDLVDRIVKKAKQFKSPRWSRQKTLLENMKTLSEVSTDEIKNILKLDPVQQPSSLSIEKGMSLKKPAKRQTPEIGFKKFEKLILEDLARSSDLLAVTWTKAYEEAGSPGLKAYKSYRYPFTPEFVEPDYFELKEIK